MGLLGLAILLSGCGHIAHEIIGDISQSSAPQVKGSGNVTTESRTVAEFDHVIVASAFEVSAQEGKLGPVKVTIDDNLQKLVKTEVKDHTLYVRLEGSTSTNAKMKLDLSTPTIKGMDGSGATQISLRLTNAHNLDIHGSGASVFAVNGPIADLKCELNGSSQGSFDAKTMGVVTANLNGAGQLRFGSMVKSLKAELSGASRLEGGMTGESADLNLSGASNAKIGKFSNVHEDVSGASHVDKP